MDFYQRVKEICQNQKINLRDMLKSQGIVYDTYKSAKRHDNLLRADDVLRIAKALGVTVEYLIEGHAPQETPILSDIYNRLPGLAQQQQEAVLALIIGFSK
jgi:transcriptional regulator with XRE-family HTH domain